MATKAIPSYLSNLQIKFTIEIHAIGKSYRNAIVTGSGKRQKKCRCRDLIIIRSIISSCKILNLDFNRNNFIGRKKNRVGITYQITR